MKPRPDALSQATKLLAATDKSRAQLRSALHRRGYDEAEAEAAVERAAQLGYVDDARVAARRAQAGLEGGWAGEALVARLVADGLDEALARRAVRQVIEASGWRAREAAARLLEKRRLSGPRAARLLASRGFEEALVHDLLGLPGEPT